MSLNSHFANILKPLSPKGVIWWNVPLILQTKWLHIVSVRSSSHAGLDFNDHNRIMNPMMDLWTWTNLITSNAWEVSVSSAPVLIIHPFCVDWLRDFSHQSLLIIKAVWQRPLLLLCLFFIHGHELLIAVHRGHQAKTVHSTASLLLTSWGRWNNKDKRLEERGQMLDLVYYRLFLCCQHYKLSSMSFSSPNATFLVTHFLAERLVIVWAYIDPECATSFSLQDRK